MWIITGASGFVGGHLLAAVDREGVGLSLRDGILDDPVRLRSKLENADAIIHCAAIVHRPSTPLEEYVRFNVEGTRALLHAATLARVRRFVFVSSIKVHGETPPGGRIDESSPVSGAAPYATTKAEAEQLVLGANGISTVVLRLSPVYGRGDKGNVRTMIRAIRRRRFLIPGSGDTRKSIVHVSTAVAALRAAAATEVGGTFVVANHDAPTIRALANVIAHALQQRPPRTVPRGLLMSISGAIGAAGRRLGISTPVSRELIEKATADSICDPSRLERELGVDTHVNLEETVREEIAWLRSTGDL